MKTHVLVLLFGLDFQEVDILGKPSQLSSQLAELGIDLIFLPC